MATKIAAVFLDEVNNQLSETSPAMKWTNVKLLDSVVCSGVPQQAESSGFMIIENKERKARGLLPVEVKIGVVATCRRAFFAVVG